MMWNHLPLKNLLRIYIFEKSYYSYAKLSLKKLYLHKSMKTQQLIHKVMPLQIFP